MILYIAGKINSATSETDDELWNIFLQATDKACGLSNNFRYTMDNQGKKAREKAQIIFNELNEEIKQFCGNLSSLIDYGKMSKEDLLQFIKPNFMRRISSLRERAAIIRETPPEILQIAGATAELKRLK